MRGCVASHVASQCKGERDWPARWLRLVDCLRWRVQAPHGRSRVSGSATASLRCCARTAHPLSCDALTLVPAAVRTALPYSLHCRRPACSGKRRKTLCAKRTIFGECTPVTPGALSATCAPTITEQQRRGFCRHTFVSRMGTAVRSSRPQPMSCARSGSSSKSGSTRPTLPRHAVPSDRASVVQAAAYSEQRVIGMRHTPCGPAMQHATYDVQAYTIRDATYNMH